MTLLLDTTVLVYAVGDDHGFRTPARAIVAAVAAGTLRATSTPEVIQEFAHVRARRRGRGDAAHLAARFADLLSPLVEVGEGDLREGLALFERHPALGAFDAVLAAVALRREVEALVSGDAAFATVTGLVHHDLAHLDLPGLELAT